MIAFYREAVYAESVTDAKLYAEAILGEEYHHESYILDYEPYSGEFSYIQETFISKTTHQEKLVVYIPAPELEEYYFKK